jgi:hypothetical protein
MSRIINPIVCVVPRRKDCARWSGLYPRLFTDFSTFIRIASDTDLCPERTRETLEIATPAWAATSSIRTLATLLDFKTLPFAGLSSLRFAEF